MISISPILALRIVQVVVPIQLLLWKDRMKVLTWWVQINSLTLNVPIPDKKKKLAYNFIFTLLCGASKGFMKAYIAFIKPFENLSSFLLQYNFLKCEGREGLRVLTRKPITSNLILSKHLPFQNQQQKHQKKMWDMFKVNNKNTRTTLHLLRTLNCTCWKLFRNLTFPFNACSRDAAIEQ